MNLFQDVATTTQLVIRLIAAVGGFVVAYLVTGPLWRLFWRVVFRRPIPPALLPWMKFSSGLVCGAILYVVVQIGGGGGGWGFGGGGTGSGTGDGKGTGNGDVVVPGDPKAKGKAVGPIAKTPGREIFAIELLGGDRYPGDGKYYLIGRKDPPVVLDQVDEALKKRPEKIELHVIYSTQSIGKHHAAADRLRELARRYQIPILEKSEEP